MQETRRRRRRKKNSKSEFSPAKVFTPSEKALELFQEASRYRAKKGEAGTRRKPKVPHTGNPDCECVACRYSVWQRGVK